MKKYVGTKVIEASPMTRGNYNNYREYRISADKNPEDACYLVKYSDDYVSCLRHMYLRKFIENTMRINFSNSSRHDERRLCRFMVKSRNLKEKPKERRLRKRALLKMQTRGFYALKYIQTRKNTDLPKKFKQNQTYNNSLFFR